MGAGNLPFYQHLEIDERYSSDYLKSGSSLSQAFSFSVSLSLSLPPFLRRHTTDERKSSLRKHRKELDKGVASC